MYIRSEKTDLGLRRKETQSIRKSIFLMDVMAFKQLSKIITVISCRTIILVEETG